MIQLLIFIYLLKRNQDARDSSHAIRYIRPVNVVCCCCQRTQLGIILTSLQDNQHIASLLGFGCPQDLTELRHEHPPQLDVHLAQVLMKTILKNLVFNTVRSVQHHC